LIYDFDRYIRQIEVFGKRGQEKLADASVLVVGAGGLGSAVIAYLAAAGIGRLGIADGDIVEKTNLQRQVIHAGNIGANKAESAAEFVEKLNPDVVVDIYPYSVTPDNVRKLVEPYDIVVGCPDNFKVRYMLNDASVQLSKPFVHAAVYAYEGEIGVFRGKPCYRCYIPRAPIEVGAAIVGATAGVFGSLQAIEVIKLVTGHGDVLEGRILRGDLYSMSFFDVVVPHSRNCPVCSGKLKGIFEENYTGSCEVVRFE